MEIGVWKGSTLISSLYENTNFGYAIDDWRGDLNEEDVRNSFLMNTNNFGLTNLKLIEKDCFDVDLSEIDNKINIFFYDGDHSAEATEKSLTYFYPVFADEFLYIVDDYDWTNPIFGVSDGIKESHLEVIYEKHLWSNCMNDADSWWNGLGIFIFKKNNT